MLESIGQDCFKMCGLESLTVPRSVKVIGRGAFCQCMQLREIVFASDSALESIGSHCFQCCGLTEVVVPRSVRSIEACAFIGCWNLSSLRFEESSHISRVGASAFCGTKLTLDSVQYPGTLQTDWSEWNEPF